MILKWFLIFYAVNVIYWIYFLLLVKNPGWKLLRFLNMSFILIIKVASDHCLLSHLTFNSINIIVQHICKRVPILGNSKLPNVLFSFMKCKLSTIFLNRHPRPLLLFIFSLFKQAKQFFTTIQCEKCPSSIRSWDFNPRPLDHDSSSLTTGPEPPSVLQKGQHNHYVRKCKFWHFNKLTRMVSGRGLSELFAATWPLLPPPPPNLYQSSSERLFFFFFFLFGPESCTQLDK